MATGFYSRPELCGSCSPAQSSGCRCPSLCLSRLLGKFEGQTGLGHVEPPDVLPLPDPARELKVLISNLLELLTEVGVSGQGRDNALTLLIKVVPRKSLKDPNNSLTLWVIDQGRGGMLERGGDRADRWRLAWVAGPTQYGLRVCTEVQLRPCWWGVCMCLHGWAGLLSTPGGFSERVSLLCWGRAGTRNVGIRAALSPEGSTRKARLKPLCERAWWVLTLPCRLTDPVRCGCYVPPSLALTRNLRAPEHLPRSATLGARPARRCPARPGPALLRAPGDLCPRPVGAGLVLLLNRPPLQV